MFQASSPLSSSYLRYLAEPVNVLASLRSVPDDQLSSFRSYLHSHLTPSSNARHLLVDACPNTHHTCHKIYLTLQSSPPMTDSVHRSLPLSDVRLSSVRRCEIEASPALAPRSSACTPSPSSLSPICRLCRMAFAPERLEGRMRRRRCGRGRMGASGRSTCTS